MVSGARLVEMGLSQASGHGMASRRTKNQRQARKEGLRKGTGTLHHRK